MAYVTTGASHHRGIANEHRLVKELRVRGGTLFPQLSEDFIVKHKGGTANKADIEIIDGSNVINISAKLKKEIDTGSYDHVNSSTALKYDMFEDFKTIVCRLANSTKDKETVRRIFAKHSHSVMKKIPSGILRSILVEHVASKNKDMTIIISDKKSGKNYVFDFKDTPLYHSIMNHTPEFVWKQNRPTQTSAKIVFRTAEGTIKDHGLRGRLVLNNGVGALLNPDKSSVPVFKVQQDSVLKAIKEIPAEKVQIFI